MSQTKSHISKFSEAMDPSQHKFRKTTNKASTLIINMRPKIITIMICSLDILWKHVMHDFPFKLDWNEKDGWPYLALLQNKFPPQYISLI